MEKHYPPLPPMHYSTLTEYLRGASLPFVTLTGDIVADSGINVLLQQIVLTGKQRCWIYSLMASILTMLTKYCTAYLSQLLKHKDNTVMYLTPVISLSLQEVAMSQAQKLVKI